MRNTCSFISFCRSLKIHEVFFKYMRNTWKIGSGTGNFMYITCISHVYLMHFAFLAIFRISIIINFIHKYMRNTWEIHDKIHEKYMRNTYNLCISHVYLMYFINISCKFHVYLMYCTCISHVLLCISHVLWIHEKYMSITWNIHEEYIR
jgi:hypothetical protein